MNTRKESTKKVYEVYNKFCFITIQNITEQNKLVWLERARKFKKNVVACLVGLEENHEEAKGLHVHILIQFSTRQKFDRDQIVECFDVQASDSINFKGPENSKESIMNVLGYVSKTGNTEQFGNFSCRGTKFESNTTDYRFAYSVKSVIDGLTYFKKVLKEKVRNEVDVMLRLKKEDSLVGTWLSKHPSAFKELVWLEQAWRLDAQNEGKKGLKVEGWVFDEEKLTEKYEAYLRCYPSIFEKYKGDQSERMLEADYADFVIHETRALQKIALSIKKALEYGPKRPHKTPNLHIWSTKATFGKTRLLQFLHKHAMTYRLPDDQYYIKYQNNLYNFLVSDEASAFLCTKTYAHLKKLFEGEPVEFNLKGKEKGICNDNPLIILAENRSFDDLMRSSFGTLYHKDIFMERMLDIEIKSRATLHFLIDHCLIALEGIECVHEPK